MTILVMLSGGVDSTAALVQALTETNEPVHVHHMHLINHEGRHEAEAEACRRIVAFCRQTYRDFDDAELTLDFSAVPWIPWDMLCICFAADQIVHKRHDIVRLVIGTCQQEGPWRQCLEQFYRMVEGAAWTARAPELLLPFLYRTRAEEVAFLPAEMRAMVWSCRRPVRADGGILPCGRCKARRLSEVNCNGDQPIQEETAT